MKPQRKLSFTNTLAAILLLIWLLLRLLLWQFTPQASIGFFELIKVLGIGLILDLVAFSYFYSFLVFIKLATPQNFSTSKLFRSLKWIVLWILIFLILFEAVAEIIFWQEFNTRYNFIAVDYLIYTNEVIGNIFESYPVTLIISALVIIALIITILISRYLEFKVSVFDYKKKLYSLIIALLIPFLALHFSDFEFTENSFQNTYSQELSKNGLGSFFSAFWRNDLDYEKFYITQSQATSNNILKKIRRDLRNANVENDKNFQTYFYKKPKNIVLITVESLSASFVGVYGNENNLTPYIDQIAHEGLKFDKLYATGTRTVRGLEALSLGTPPIPGQAIVRRPENQHLSTIGEYLEQQGVQTEFIYGGYGYFDNMNNYFKGNDYKVFDRTDFDNRKIVFENIWGVADESLYDNSVDYINKKIDPSKPFFIHIMTTSNHRPYTFPSGRIDMPPGSRDSAVKYTDYAIGHFLKLARSQPWFNDTLFVIVADHCASVAGKTKIPVAKYHIPMIFYGPSIVKKGSFPKVISQIDVPPTLIRLMGYKGADHFFGDNIFGHNYNERAFVSNYQSLGYYKNNKLVVLLPKRKVEIYQVNPKNYSTFSIEIDNELLQEAIAYYQTASIQFKKGLLKEVNITK